jgi:hypothetical protein
VSKCAGATRDGGGKKSRSDDEDYLEHDDNAYARALAESDTCDNSSCPRGPNELASWTIIVEEFDESSEEFHDRTFRACASCNRSCKKSFMTYKIKSRKFDNSSKELLATAATTRTAGTLLPLRFRVLAFRHRRLTLPAPLHPWRSSQSSLMPIASHVNTRSLRALPAHSALSAATATNFILPPPALNFGARLVLTSRAQHVPLPTAAPAANPGTQVTHPQLSWLLGSTEARVQLSLQKRAPALRCNPLAFFFFFFF